MEYNILTCDDEQIVIDSLQFIIKKNFEGQVNLFSALSGTEAIEVCTKNSIDIIFMDINMPGITGLDAIRCILNLKPSTVVVVLSAFDKFQYAQEAMNLGAFKYITKPVNRNVVIQTVRNAMNLVDERHVKNSDDDDLRKKLDIVSPMVESDFIYSCIFNSEKTDDVSTYLEYFNMDVKHYFFMCIEVPRVDSKNQFEVCSKIRSVLSGKYSCIIGSFMVDRLVMFFSVKKAFEDETVEDTFRQTAKNVYTALTINISQGIRAGVSLLSDDIFDVTSCYNDANAAMNNSSPNGEILFAENMKNEGTVADFSQVKERLLNRLRLGDGAGVQFLSGLYFSSREKAGLPENKVKNSVFDLLFTVRNVTEELAPSFDSSLFDDAYSVVSSAKSFAEIQEFVGARLFDCCSAILESREKKDNPVIGKVCKFIEENISKDISLDEAASVAGVSPFYLSKLFREETGETFINFVTDKRLEKAKQMLLETNLSIKEISSSSGYNDQNYFSRLFKNKFAVSPKDFRNSN